MFVDQTRLDFTGPLQLTVAIQDGADQWFVEWIRVTLGKRTFYCPILGWLEYYHEKWTKDKDPLRLLGPQERKVKCTFEGKTINKINILKIVLKTKKKQFNVKKKTLKTLKQLLLKGLYCFQFTPFFYLSDNLFEHIKHAFSSSSDTQKSIKISR